MQPKNIIFGQKSWRPNVELVELPENVFVLLCLVRPLVMITYETAKKIKAALAKEVNLGFRWRCTPRAVSQTLRTRVSLLGQKML